MLLTQYDNQLRNKVSYRRTHGTNPRFQSHLGYHMAARDRWAALDGGRNRRRKSSATTTPAERPTSRAVEATKLRDGGGDGEDKSKQKAYFRRAVTTAFEEIFKNKCGGQREVIDSTADVTVRNRRSHNDRRRLSSGFVKERKDERVPEVTVVPSSTGRPANVVVAAVHDDHSDEHNDYRRSSYRTAIKKSKDQSQDRSSASNYKEASSNETTTPADSFYTFYNSRGGAKSYFRPRYNNELYWSYLNKPINTHVLYPIGERSSSFHHDPEGVSAETGDSSAVKSNNARVNARNRKAKSWYEADTGEFRSVVESDVKADSGRACVGGTGVKNSRDRDRVLSQNLNQYRYPRFDDNVTYRRSVYDVADDDKTTSMSARTFRPSSGAAGLIAKRAQSVERYLNQIGKGGTHEASPLAEGRNAYRATSMPAYVSSVHHFPDTLTDSYASATNDNKSGSPKPAATRNSIAQPTDRKTFDYSPSASKYSNNVGSIAGRAEDSWQNKDQGKPLTLVDKIRRRIVQDRYVPSSSAYHQQSSSVAAVDDYQPDREKSYLFGKYSKWTPSSSAYPPANSRIEETGSRIGTEAVDKPKKKRNIWQQFGRRKTTDMLPSNYNAPSTSVNGGGDESPYLKRANSPIGKIKGFFSNCTTWRNPDDKSSSIVSFRGGSATTNYQPPHDSASYSVNNKSSYKTFYRKAPRPLSYVPPVRHRYDESTLY